MIYLGSSWAVETIMSIFVAIPSVECHGAPDGMEYLFSGLKIYVKQCAD